MRGRPLLVTVALVLVALLVLGVALWWLLFMTPPAPVYWWCSRRCWRCRHRLRHPRRHRKTAGTGNAAGRDDARTGAAGSADAYRRADADPGQQRSGDDECRRAGRWRQLRHPVRQWWRFVRCRSRRCRQRHLWALPRLPDAAGDLARRKVKRLAFQLQVNVWLASDGRLEKVELVRGSGNEEADAPCSMPCVVSARSTRHRRRRLISPPAS